jgi:hypothetical protein
MNMKFLKYVAGICVSFALVACGGGGGSAGGVITPVGETPASIDVLNTSGAGSLLSGGAEATITAYVKNTANVGLSGKTVTFASTSGNLLVGASVTGEGGIVTAKLTAGADKSIRTITVTVTSGSASGSITVPVTGTTLSVAGSGSLQVGGPVATYTVRAVDSSSNPIGGAKVALTSTLGNAVSPAEATTDATGSASFQYAPATAGTDTLKAAGLGTASSTSVVVTAVDFAALAPASNATIAVGASQLVTVRYRLSGVGVAGQTVNFTTTRGVFAAPSSVVTDANGDASANLSSTTAGPGVVVAQIAGVGQVIIPVQFVATVPATIFVQANPGAILPNTSGTTNQSTIEVSVRDATGNAVANRQVNFSTLKDVSNGTLSPGSAMTDSNGRAQVQFISGASSTPANGVEIQAEVAGTAIKGVTTLTVNGKSLFITIGFGNTISNLNETTYSKEFSVYVTDANGVAVGNQAVVISVIPEKYYKGDLARGTESWGVSRPDVYGLPDTVCANEDRNRDGVFNVGEDTNGDGQLTPGNVVVAAPGLVTTDAAGRARFDLQYGEQFALWITARITASASVAGTESRQSILHYLPMAAGDANNVQVTPANHASPFGRSTSCTDPN